MPCIKAEHNGVVAVTMPLSPILGTPIYHFNVVRVPLKIWSELSPKLQQAYKSRMLTVQQNSSPNRVSYIQILAIYENNSYEYSLLKVNIIDKELQFADLDKYDDQTLIDTYIKHAHKNPKKIRWTLKNVCI